MPDRLPSIFDRLAAAPRPDGSDRLNVAIAQKRTDAQAAVEVMRKTTRWRGLRRVVLARRPLCADCLAHGRTEPATQVDHIRAAVQRPDLFFDIDNLQGLCTTCHARKSVSERASARRASPVGDDHRGGERDVTGLMPRARAPGLSDFFPGSTPPHGGAA